MLNCAGIVLCGGQSRRMGQPKALLPFGPEVMLSRICRLLGEVVDPVVVVAGARSELPESLDRVVIARDRHEDRGPLEGLAAGLAALAGRAEAAFVTGCDVPLLKPELVRHMIELASGYDAAVPHVSRLNEPLAAVYRVDVLTQVEAMLAAGHRRPVSLLERVNTRRVTPGELTEVDPQLESFFNVNTPTDYQAALAKAGFEAPGIA